MLYGIISDIHSNLEALNVVLNKLYQAEKLVCLGDIVGYGPDPNLCVEKVRELNIPTVAGNHDKAVTGEMETTWFNQSAREAVIWTQREIKEENLEYLRNLPEIIEEDDFQAVHGSLRAPLEEYIMSISDALPTFEKMTKPVCFIGHSHAPLFIALKKDGNYDGRVLLDGEEVLVEDHEKVIINVGGVGQPRDGDPRASYGIYDSKTKIFTLHRVEYNIERVQGKMKTVGLPQPLIARLQFGR
ncbi:MAG: metallophosphoesterase family protein [Candidatus Margulisiibacteriota bacterium]